MSLCCGCEACLFEELSEQIIRLIRVIRNEETGSLEVVRISQHRGLGLGGFGPVRMTGRLPIMQIEKHNVNVYPMLRILMVLDVWEHAYYLDYKNERPKFVEAFLEHIELG
jgi:superoxide dismutase